MTTAIVTCAVTGGIHTSTMSPPAVRTERLIDGELSGYALDACTAICRVMVAH